VISLICRKVYIGTGFLHMTDQIGSTCRKLDTNMFSKGTDILSVHVPHEILIHIWTWGMFWRDRLSKGTIISSGHLNSRSMDPELGL
jgi:hypothetical protein